MSKEDIRNSGQSVDLENERQNMPSVLRDVRGRIIWRLPGNSPEENEELGIKNMQALILEKMPELKDFFSRDGTIYDDRRDEAGELIKGRYQEKKDFKTIFGESSLSRVIAPYFEGSYRVVLIKSVAPWGVDLLRYEGRSWPDVKNIQGEEGTDQNVEPSINIGTIADYYKLDRSTVKRDLQNVSYELKRGKSGKFLPHYKQSVVEEKLKFYISGPQANKETGLYTNAEGKVYCAVSYLELKTGMGNNTVASRLKKSGLSWIICRDRTGKTARFYDESQALQILSESSPRSGISPKQVDVVKNNEIVIDPSHELAWMLGVLSGRGHIRFSGGNITLGGNQELLEKFRLVGEELFQTAGDLVSYFYNGKEYKSVRFVNVEIPCALGNLSVTEWIYTINEKHDWILENQDYLRDFIEGLYETSGSATTNGERIRFSTIYLDVALYIEDLLRRFGIRRPKISYQKKGEKIRGVGIFNLRDLKFIAEKIHSVNPAKEEDLEFIRGKTRLKLRAKSAGVEIYPVDSDEQLLEEYKMARETCLRDKNRLPTKQDIVDLRKQGNLVHSYATFADHFGKGSFIRAQKSMELIISGVSSEEAKSRINQSCISTKTSNERAEQLSSQIGIRDLGLMERLDRLIQEDPAKYPSESIERVRQLVEYELENSDSKKPYRLFKEVSDFIIYHQLHPEWQNRSVGEMSKDIKSGASAFYGASKYRINEIAGGDKKKIRKLMEEIFSPKTFTWVYLINIEDWVTEFNKHPEWQEITIMEMTNDKKSGASAFYAAFLKWVRRTATNKDEKEALRRVIFPNREIGKKGAAEEKISSEEANEWLKNLLQEE